MLTSDDDPGVPAAQPPQSPAGEHDADQDTQRVITLELTDLAAGGDAVGRYEGRAIFVTGGLPGELARARIRKERNTFARAEVVEILRPSPDRVAPPYPELGASGGFQWQFLAYPAQLTWKTRIMRQQLTRIGRFVDPVVHPMIGMPTGSDLWRYRTVTQFAVGPDGAIGFRRVGSHDVIDMPDCPLAHPGLEAIYRAVRAWLRATWGALAADVVGRFSVRIGLGGDPASGKEPDQVAGVLTLEASAVAPLDASERLALCERALASSPDLVGALMLGPTSGHSRALAGRDYVYERVLERTFRVSAGSFFQVNHAQTPTLVQQALAAARIQSTERVLDGYSGVGLFSLFLAERAQQVWAIESQSSAVADARANAVANGVENVTTMAGHMEHVIGELRRTGERIDVALVDPPRTGCAPRALRAIRDLAPRALVYVSCDPSTLARDLRLFCEEGYQLAWAQPVDMFPFTSHIECVALCERTAEPQSRVI